MIWLPGVLSQGGDKYTWGRYSFDRKEVISENETVVHGGGDYVYISASYTVTDGELYLGTNYNMGVWNLSAGDYYAIDSGKGAQAVIYEVVSYTEVSNGYQVVRKAHRMQDFIGVYIDTVEATSADAYPENGVQGDYWYVRYSDTPITWERYTTSETEVKGASVTQTATSSTYFYRATSYSRSGKTFTATGTRTRASSLAVGNYLIQQNGAFVNSTSMSGDTLFKITKKSGSYTVSLTFDTYTVGDVKGSYVDSVTSYNPYEFPDDGAQDGYWYVKVETGSVSNGIATFVIQNFDLDGATVTATCPVGTTWAEFIESDDNTISLYIGELGGKQYVCPRSGGIMYVGGSSTNSVLPSDIIDPTLYYRCD